MSSGISRIPALRADLCSKCFPIFLCFLIIFLFYYSGETLWFMGVEALVSPDFYDSPFSLEDYQCYLSLLTLLKDVKLSTRQISTDPGFSRRMTGSHFGNCAELNGDTANCINDSFKQFIVIVYIVTIEIFLVLVEQWRIREKALKLKSMSD